MSKLRQCRGSKDFLTGTAKERASARMVKAMLSGSPLNGLTSLQLPGYEPLFRITEMKSLQFHGHGIVYGLCGIDRKIFYIGCTTWPNFRFNDPVGYSTKVLKRMKQCGDDLFVCVVASSGHNQKDKLLKLETDLIMYHGDSLLNQRHNGFDESHNDEAYWEFRNRKKVVML